MSEVESKSQKKSVVAVRYSTQRAFKTDAREDVFLYSLRQKRELQPHRSESSRTGAHGAKVWYLLPGRYFVSRQDISGSGNHRCYNAWLIIGQDGSIKEEKTREIPEFVDNLACECLERVEPYQ
jgi:hypothetical protein